MYTHKTTGYVRPTMSHSVTVTRTTTSTTTSAIILHTGYLKTFPGILRVLEVILAGVCLGIVCYYSNHSRYIQYEFFMCSACSVFFGSFCLFLACILTISVATIISKTMYELIYHFFAFVLMFASSVTLLVDVNDRRNSNHPYFVASILGLILSALYLIHSILAYRSFKGI